MLPNMQIFVAFLIVSSVLGFHNGFRKFIIGGAVLMDCVSCFKHLALGCGRFKEMYRILGLILLFGFGLKFIFSNHFYCGLLRFLCGLSGKSVNSKFGFCSKFVLADKFGMSIFSKPDSSSKPLMDEVEMDKIQNLNSCTGVDGETESDSHDKSDVKSNEGDEKEYKGNDTESDITRLRELLKIERQRVDDVCAELAKERAAAATAAEEAMAMILRLQSEKSLVEMEWSQYRRLTEEKQIHDQHVIRSLQWLVWQHELRTEDRPTTPCSSRMHKLKDDEESDECFNGNILDALENVLYSSRDSDCLSP